VIQHRSGRAEAPARHLERSRQLRIGAQIRREGGDLQAEYGRSAAKAHEISGMATLFEGAGSFAARYARPGGRDTGSFAAGADFYDD
jgi:hypothetical protein